MRCLSLTCLCALLTGCASVNAPDADSRAARIAEGSPKAQLTIYRPSRHVQYVARSASLKLNAESIGGIASGGIRVLEIAPGSHSIEADMWDAPGRCTLTFTVRDGESVYFEVAPRSNSLLAGTPGALMPVEGAGGLFVGLAVMLAGMSVESSAKQCGGAFSIEQVDPEAANIKLSALRASKQAVAPH